MHRDSIITQLYSLKSKADKMKNFVLHIKTEFGRIFSNPVVMLIFFAAPLLYGVLSANIYKKGKLTELPVVIIDEDHSALSSKIIDALNDNETIRVVKVQFEAGNIAAEMPSKEYIAVISIPQSFESAILQKKYPEILIDVNTANLVTANFASRAIQTVLGTLNAGIEIESLKKGGMDDNTARQRFEPFRATYTRFYNPSGNYLELMFPGVLGTVMQQIIFLGLGLVFARDLEDGYFKKLALKNKSAVYHILLKGIPFTILTSIVWLMVGCFFLFYKIDMPVFRKEMIVLVTVFSLACMFIAMLVSIIIPNQLKATEVLMVVATPSFLLSGYTWPLEGMPVLIQQIANMIPVTHFLQAFRKIGIYHGTLADIYPQLKALSIMAVTCMVLLALIIKIKIIKANRKQNRLTAV